MVTISCSDKIIIINLATILIKYTDYGVTVIFVAQEHIVFLLILGSAVVY